MRFVGATADVPAIAKRALRWWGWARFRATLRRRRQGGGGGRRCGAAQLLLRGAANRRRLLIDKMGGEKRAWCWAGASLFHR